MRPAPRRLSVARPRRSPGAADQGRHRDPPPPTGPHHLPVSLTCLEGALRRHALAAARSLLARAAAAARRTAAGRQRRRAAPPRRAPGKDSEKVGFIFVGPKDDFGYNQAAYEGSPGGEAEAFPDMEVLTAENVPEDDEAARVMEAMIDKGAKIIFATSYGHLDPAMKVADGPPRRRGRAAGQLHPGHHPRPTPAPTSARCTSPCTWPASPPGRSTAPAASRDPLARWPSRERRAGNSASPQCIRERQQPG